jgi:hypothetical protein
MAKIKNKKIKVESPVYVPREHTEIYVYIRKYPNRLQPVPYSCKLNYQYLLPLIPKQNEKRAIHTN